jgi:hypothetical protein
VTHDATGWARSPRGLGTESSPLRNMGIGDKGSYQIVSNEVL